MYKCLSLFQALNSACLLLYHVFMRNASGGCFYNCTTRDTTELLSIEELLFYEKSNYKSKRYKCEKIQDDG